MSIGIIGKIFLATRLLPNLSRDPAPLAIIAALAARRRVENVVKSVTYLKERVNALVDIWSKDKLAKIELAAKPQKIRR